MNKVSKESIEKKIVDKIFKKLSGKLTHCTLILENGFEVTGESACVDPANYDKVIGESIAFENAFEKIWAVEGYLLQEKLYSEKKLQDKSGNLLLTANTDKIKEAFLREYPITQEQAFLHDRAIANEPSFIEKYEKIMEPVITDDKPCTTIKIDNERNIKFNKLCRQELDIIIQELKGSKRKSPERSTAIRKAIEATMWLGMDLKAIGTPNPYPESKNPNNTTVEPTADGLKL
jgi:hypothetical protein